MKTGKTTKEEQVRRTLNDIVSAQNKLRMIVKKKILHNDVLCDQEVDEWDKLCAYALFKYGNQIDAKIDFPGDTIMLGKVHTFALHFIDYDKKIVIHNAGKKYTFSISKLWKVLYSYFDVVFPYAQEAGFYLSKEEIKVEDWSAYRFDADRKI